MTVHASCACPGTHHLEAAALTSAVLVDEHAHPHDWHAHWHALVDGVEYELIDVCPDWPALIAARLIPQHHAARTPAER